MYSSDLDNNCSSRETPAEIHVWFLSCSLLPSHSEHSVGHERDDGAELPSVLFTAPHFLWFCVHSYKVVGSNPRSTTVPMIGFLHLQGAKSTLKYVSIGTCERSGADFPSTFAATFYKETSESFLSRDVQVSYNTEIQHRRCGDIAAYAGLKVPECNVPTR